MSYFKISESTRVQSSEHSTPDWQQAADNATLIPMEIIECFSNLQMLLTAEANIEIKLFRILQAKKKLIKYNLRWKVISTPTGFNKVDVNIEAYFDEIIVGSCLMSLNNLAPEDELQVANTIEIEQIELDSQADENNTISGSSSLFY